MIPSDFPYDREALFLAWQQYVALGGQTPSQALDPAVLRSWQRCRQVGLDPFRIAPQQPIDPATIEAHLHARFDLIAVARPFIEDIYQSVGERDALVFLTDQSLRILEVVGDQELRDALRRSGFRTGSSLAEEFAGTNAAALAQSEGAPVQVVGPEHYCTVGHTLADAAVPIHAPAGESAVLGIVTREQDAHPYMLGIVLAAARAIENQLQADQSLSETLQHLTELNIALEAMSKGIIFLDTEWRITHVNSQAGEILDLAPRSAMGRSLGAVLEPPPEAQASLRERTPMPEKEVIFHCRGKPRPCLLSIDVLWQDRRPRGFVLMLEHRARVRQLVQRIVGARAHFTFDDILGQDVEMRRLLRHAQLAARDDACVLLLGESGTGKDMLACAIHNASRRASGPFVAINCAAVPRRLQAVDLFGYEGMFVGPGEESRPGKLELADGGTVFLDNVDALSLDVQAGLVRVIDTRSVVRLGATRATPLDLRIIASSSKMDLAQEARQGHFRTDLFYRLHVLTLTIPPLRERGNDVLLLVNHFVDKASAQLGKTVTASPGAMAVLQSYRWPGNVRELENVLERAIHLVEGSELTVQHLPRELRLATPGAAEAPVSLQEAERLAIIRAGRALRGNTSRMAEALGIGRTTLWRKMKAFKLSPESFKGTGEPAKRP